MSALEMAMRRDWSPTEPRDMASIVCPISRWTLLLFAIKGKSVTTSPGLMA